MAQNDILHALWKVLDQLFKMERMILEMTTTVMCQGSGAPAYFYQSTVSLHTIELRSLVHTRNLLARYVNIDPIQPYAEDILLNEESADPRVEIADLFSSFGAFGLRVRMYYMDRVPHVGRQVPDVFRANIKLAIPEFDNLIVKVWEVTSRFINSQEKANTP